MTEQIRRIHRWIGLTFLIFWLLQAASGLFLTFHREIDDWSLGYSNDPQANVHQVLAKASELAERRDANVTGIFSSTGYSNRFDVHLSDRDTGASTIARLNGAGALIMERPLEARLLEGGIYLTVHRFHRQLLAGNTGSWIVGISGIFLLSNFLLGLKLAWPARGQWRKALVPKFARSALATVYCVHRAMGLWVAPLALVTVSCGVLLVFEKGVATGLGAAGDRPPLETNGSAKSQVDPAAAVDSATAIFPGATFTGMQMANEFFPYLTVFLRQDRELHQAYGATRVYVSASDGSVAAVYNPRKAGGADRFMSALLPIHTGQAGGLPGRIIVAGIAVWLIATIGLGTSLWWLRRRKRAERG